MNMLNIPIHYSESRTLTSGVILLTFVAANANASLDITFESAWTISVHRDSLLFKHNSLILYLLALYLLPFVYAIYAIYAFTFSW
jgi:hypothetical protein